MIIRLFALPLALLLPTAAFADARIDFRSTEGSGASIQSFLIGHGKVRTDADAETSVILDPANEAMILLNHADRQYTRMQRADIEKIASTVNAAMAQMEEALANVPPEMRDQMRGMLGDSLPTGGSKMSVKATGQRDTVASYACEVYQTRMDGKLLNETCMGNASLFDELSASDRQALERSLAMTQRLAESLSEGPLAQYVDMSSFHSGMIPLRVTDIDGGKRSTSEFAGIDDSALPADLFAVPAGYREQKLEMPNLGR